MASNQLVIMPWGQSIEDTQDKIYLDFQHILDEIDPRVMVYSDPNTTGESRSKSIKFVGDSATGGTSTNLMLTVVQDVDNTLTVSLGEAVTKKV